MHVASQHQLATDRMTPDYGLGNFTGAIVRQLAKTKLRPRVESFVQR